MKNIILTNTNMDFSKFLQKTYWFDISPEGNSLALLWILVSCVLLIIGALVSRFYLKQKAANDPTYNRLLEKSFSTLITCGISGIVLIFFRWQEIPYLANRIPLLLIAIYLIFWKIYIIIYYRTTFQRARENYANKQLLNKYLPKAKNIRRSSSA